MEINRNDYLLKIETPLGYGMEITFPTENALMEGMNDISCAVREGTSLEDIVKYLSHRAAKVILGGRSTIQQNNRGF